MAKKTKTLTMFTGTVLDQVFSSSKPIYSLSSRIWNPPTDIFENDDQVIIRMEVPGVDPEGLSVTADGRRLVVSGRREEPESDGLMRYHLMEVQYGEFERVFEFPYSLSNAHVEARFKAGFLSIKVENKSGKKLDVGIEIIVDTSES